MTTFTLQAGNTAIVINTNGKQYVQCNGTALTNLNHSGNFWVTKAKHNVDVFYDTDEADKVTDAAGLEYWGVETVRR